MTAAPAWGVWIGWHGRASLHRLENRGLNAPELNEAERRHKIAEPFPIADAHLGLGLDELAKLYPAPGSYAAEAKTATDAAKAIANKLQALADDPGATEYERKTAAMMAADRREREKT